LIEDYFRQIDTLLAGASIVHSSSITYDKRSTYIGFIRGEIYFLGSCLHFREFVNVEQAPDRYMYVYHYQYLDDAFVFRYNNTPHFPDLPTFPHHKHEGSESNVVPATPPDLQAVLAETQRLITTSAP